MQFKVLRLFTTHLNHLFSSRKFTAHLRLKFDTCVFATIWCTSRIFAMWLVHTTFALRSIYEQRFVCDCLVHAAPGPCIWQANLSTPLLIINQPPCESSRYGKTAGVFLSRRGGNQTAIITQEMTSAEQSLIKVKQGRVLQPPATLPLF